MIFSNNTNINRSIILRNTVKDVVANDANAALNSMQDV